LSAVAALALAFALAPVAHAANKLQPRIVNGDPVTDITDFPYQVALYNPAGAPFDTQFCGGVILDATHVVTAAHCLFDFPEHPQQVSRPSEVSVLAGTTTLSDSSNDVVHDQATRLSFDPGYDPDTGDHDIGLVVLSQPLWDGADPPIDGNSTIAPISTIDDGDFQDDLDAVATDPGSIVTTVSGWGWDLPVEPGGSPEPTESHPFPDQLNAVDVPLIDQTTCENDFKTEPNVTQIAGLTLFCAGDDADETNANNKDSCNGDSGGPIVIDPTKQDPAGTGEPQLIGLVDSGFGCAWAHLPGIYSRISAQSIQEFLASDPPAAPSQDGTITISGGNQPGDTVVCDGSHAWDDPDAHLTYSVTTTSGAPLSDGNTYTIAEKDRGTSIECQVEAKNAGGYGFGHSSSVFVPTPVVTPPPGNNNPPPAKDTTAPKLRVTSKKCTRTSCTVKVKVTDAGFSAGIAKVRATLNYTRKVSCRKHGKKTTCNKRAHRSLRAAAGKNGAFTIVAKHLKAGTGYSISLLPVDKAGNKPKSSTTTKLRTQRPHRRGSRS
jgi:secreted trypsin-like serine protease